jgi:ferredoxin
MAEVHFLTARGRIALAIAELAVGDEASLLDAVRHAGLPLGQSCRGEGVCRSCAVDVEDGVDHLGPPSPLERRFKFGDTRRLACQARLPTAAEPAIVVVAHSAWGRPPAVDPAVPTCGPGATLEP